jgi:hypothetical protein
LDNGRNRRVNDEDNIFWLEQLEEVSFIYWEKEALRKVSQMAMGKVVAQDIMFENIETPEHIGIPVESWHFLRKWCLVFKELCQNIQVTFAAMDSLIT